MLIGLGLPIAITITAALYASVGQAGATGYIAIFGLIGFGPEVIKPAALSLNILVAAIGSFRFIRAGLLTWRTCYPFAVLGAPFSVLGGAINLPAAYYQPLVGCLLLLACAQMIRSARGAAQRDQQASHDPPFLRALLTGGAVGFISGITGTGGGIFLAPIVLTYGWVETRRASAVSAAFNLMNSTAALAGTWATLGAFPAALPWWLLAAGIGGAFGSWLGVRYLPVAMLRYILAALVGVAGARMLLA